MRRTLDIVLLVAALLPWAAAGQDRPLVDLGGERLSAEQLQRGSWIAVVWASWSPRCRDIVERVNAIEGRWGSQARVVTINFQEDAADVRAFLAGQRLAAPVFLDPDAAFSKKHSITHLPGLLVIKDGRTAFTGRLPALPDAVIGQALE